MAEDEGYEVGYRNPPKASQFQKGKSGNSHGRPKQEAGIASVFRKISKQKVRANGPNGQQCMTKLEASITQLVNKSASGDLKAMKVLMQMASRFPELVTDPETIRIRIVVIDPKPTTPDGDH
jgi:hypothetical protein